jgi:hypothetical protein
MKMITQEEWNKLKENEKYGMYAQLFNRINYVEDRLKSVETGLMKVVVQTWK